VSLQLRQLPWDFDTTVPFQWNPTNPRFGLLVNSISFSAIPFERYMVAAIREAGPLITDPAIAREADLFLRQEAIHARAHRGHVHALIEQYPGLQETADAVAADYDALFECESLEFHLAFAADIEATFTPVFKMLLDNRATLFEPGDDRVASLLLWHFSEEIEHRSSALRIYEHVVGKPWYRLQMFPRVFRHVSGISAKVFAGFDEHVPVTERLVSLAPRRLDLRALVGRRTRRESHRGDPYPTAYERVPRSQLAAMLWRLALSQVPNHDPEHQPLPAFAGEWFDAYEAGRDVTHWYGSAAAAC
jgi:Predicted metal-dependent hydrolase